MQYQDRISNLLLQHWQKHQPKMFRQLQQENRLQEELEVVAKLFFERLYELKVIQKLPYPSAWEVVTAEILKGEPEEDESISTNPPPNPSPPVISE